MTDAPLRTEPATSTPRPGPPTDQRATHVLGPPEPLTAVRRCLVMGVLNVTPDSFSDGGRYLDHDAAVAQGLALHVAGADLVDVGGESTRPGAQRVPEQEEQARVLPVIEELAARGVVVSVDTMRAATATAALEAGAALVNDVSGGLADPKMAAVVADARVPYVLMHWRGHSVDMQQRAAYGDVVRDVRDELAARLDAMVAAGVDPAQIVLDPGLGFAKSAPQSWAVLAGLEEFAGLGRPLLVGASRKSFLGALLALPTGEAAPPALRDEASAAVTALAAAAGAWAVRVHDPSPSLAAVKVVAAWHRARRSRSGADLDSGLAGPGARPLRAATGPA